MRLTLVENMILILIGVFFISSPGFADDSLKEREALVKTTEQTLELMSKYVHELKANSDLVASELSIYWGLQKKISELEKKKSKAADPKELSSINSQIEKLKADSDSHLAAVREFRMKFMLASISYKNHPDITDPSFQFPKKAEILKVIKNADEKFPTINPLNEISKSDFKLKLGSSLPGNMCTGLSSIHHGTLARNKVDPNFDIKTVEYKNGEEFVNYMGMAMSSAMIDEEEYKIWRPSFDPINLGLYSFCRLAALSGYEVAGGAVDTRDLYKLYNYASNSTSAEGLTKCIDGILPQEKMEKVTALLKQYPDNSALKLIAERKSFCQNMAGYLCSDAYVLKDTVIMRYQTMGCEIRSVTKGDVENDIEKWKNIGMEEAKQLEHAQLGEVISVCQKAYDKGFTWVSTQLNVDKNCVKRNK